MVWLRQKGARFLFDSCYVHLFEYDIGVCKNKGPLFTYGYNE